jgi:deoxyribodipyrimidine photo-lyase
MSRPLVWFRRDLRTVDNSALHHAARKASRGVVSAFVVCSHEWLRHDDAPVKIDFWLRSLRVLSADLSRLNIPLVMVNASSVEDVPRALLSLAKRARCTSLWFNREYEVDEARRDEAVRRTFEADGLNVVALHDRVVFDPASHRTGDGRAYSVFTPFRNRFIRRVWEEGIEVLSRPRRQPPIDVSPSPVPESVEGNSLSAQSDLWRAGETEALKRLRSFCRRRIGNYGSSRDMPAIDGTSALSPYLAAGVLSPRQCLAEARDANGGQWESGESDGATKWITELIWREFYQQVLVSFPRVSMNQPFKLATRRIRWSRNAEHLERWRQGRTGIPIVDAGMRQLLATGWMHNRVRMVTAMYFTKDLFLDWRLGERHFMRCLIDGDLGSNNGGWQWCASTGCDAAPYFRIFNPVSQSERFDRDGEFIRRWVPELAEVPGIAIHDPSRLTEAQRRRLDYPLPLVDRKGVRERVVAAFRGTSQSRT